MIRHVCAGLALAVLLAAPAMAEDCPDMLAEIDAVLAQAPKVMVQWEEGDFDELPSIAVTHGAQTAPHGGIAVTVVENEDTDELPTSPPSPAPWSRPAPTAWSGAATGPM